MSPLSLVFAFIGLVILAFVVLAIIAPFESLGWWAGWGRDDPGPMAAIQAIDTRPVNEPAPHYIVYLSGVGRLSGNERTGKEDDFLNRVQALLPTTVIVRDVFPFSATGTPLNGQRLLAGLWTWIDRLQHKHLRAWLYNFIQFRNLTQVAVSADPRYGRVYSTGLAREIVRHLLEHGYDVGSKAHVTLMCISGGGQVSVGVGPVLLEMLGRPVNVISIGGVLTDDPGVLLLERLYHLSGDLDNIQYIGKWLFPGRWSWLSNSAWNRAMRKGKIKIINVGPMKHMGWGDYFSRSAKLPDGTINAARTASVVADVVKEIEQGEDSHEAHEVSRSF
jgi:hypothetical protein